MCELCEGGGVGYLKPNGYRDDISLYLSLSHLYVFIEYSLFGEGEEIEMEYQINYCPKCGRDLRGGDAS